MKCAGFFLTAMIGFAHAAPVQQSWIEPGGEHIYESSDKSLVRRRTFFKLGKFKTDEKGNRIVDPIDLTIAGTLFSSAVGFFIGPLGARWYNDKFGVQESAGAKAARERVEKDAADAKAAAAAAAAKGGKRSVDVDDEAEDLDLPSDEARELYLSSYVDLLYKLNPYGGETDAAVCTAVGYQISDPSKTLKSGAFKYTAQGQDYDYDCFILAGPVTVEVDNASDADFVWEGPTGATFSNGVLTIA